MQSKFQVGNHVIHEKTGNEYIIFAVPGYKRLDSCNETYYEYYAEHMKHIWLRSKSEMEDGRFILKEK